MSILLLLVGIVILTIGAEVLVRGAASLALSAKISPLVVGLTVVAFGTSAPELVVSLQSTLRGQSDIALGNVLGSNIFNVLFILGLSALITPLVVSRQLVRFEVPLMVLLSGLLGLLALDGRIGRGDGILLFVALLVYTTWAVIKSRREERSNNAELEVLEAIEGKPVHGAGPIVLQILLLLAGLTLLVLGSRLFSDSAVEIARRLGVSELVIGLTLVAAGTSLPEVATSVLAALRGQRDIAVGNVVGSNLFNIMGVLGISATAAAEGIGVSAAALRLDIPVMIAVAVACLPIFFTGHLLSRWEGALLLAYYFAYTFFLILAATQATIERGFATVMVVFVIPLTVLTLIIGVARNLRTTP
ncbi:calcium/sodium antiporter [Candidatus Laterigemmans baculatus]|uniref:calcium/sodium antiporter n=1 Tax=Candidatus Laterigemmans baculatus TaxID=2770505 RepID=UPI001F36A757|nr:calcium/sodium antiporter [Candidatus Laterigemmans baculatus]